MMSKYDKGIVTVRNLNTGSFIKCPKVLKKSLSIFRSRQIDLIHDSRHVGFAFIRESSYTFLRGQTTQV